MDKGFENVAMNLLGMGNSNRKEDEVREILVKRMQSGEIVKRVDVTGQSEINIERCMMGMLINMNQEDFRIEDTDWTKKEVNDDTL